MSGTAPELVVLPSALLGPVVAEPLVEALRACRRPARVVESGVPGTADELARRYRAAIRGNRPLVLVAHSNAGLFVPGLLAEPTVRGAVLVDALLPAAAVRPGSSVVDVVPAERRAAIPTAADGSPLAWPFWWSDDQVDGLYPDRAARRAVERRAPRLPGSFFSSRIRVPSITDRRGGYLSFGDTYRAERDRAAALGWPTRRLDGGHLHLLTDPSAVARAVVDIAEAAGLG